jgi:TolA-binding protein
VDLDKFVSAYKASPRLDEARLFLGTSLAASGKKQEGLAVLDELGRRLSDRWVGQEAQRRAAVYRKN